MFPASKLTNPSARPPAGLPLLRLCCLNDGWLLGCGRLLPLHKSMSQRASGAYAALEGFGQGGSGSEPGLCACRVERLLARLTGMWARRAAAFCGCGTPAPCPRHTSAPARFPVPLPAFLCSIPLSAALSSTARSSLSSLLHKPQVGEKRGPATGREWLQHSPASDAQRGARTRQKGHVESALQQVRSCRLCAGSDKRVYWNRRRGAHTQVAHIREAEEGFRAVHGGRRKGSGLRCAEPQPKVCMLRRQHIRRGRAALNGGCGAGKARRSNGGGLIGGARACACVRGVLQRRRRRVMARVVEAMGEKQVTNRRHESIKTRRAVCRGSQGGTARQLCVVVGVVVGWGCGGGGGGGGGQARGAEHGSAGPGRIPSTQKATWQVRRCVASPLRPASCRRSALPLAPAPLPLSCAG